MFDDLPDEPELAFVQVHQGFQDELEEKLRETENSFASHSAYVRYMSKTKAAATELGIEALSPWVVPSSSGSDFTIFYDFDSAVTAMLTQIQIRHARRDRRYSVRLNTAERERIRHLLNQVREIVDAMDLPLNKRDAINDRISALQAEIERERTRLDAFAGMLITLGQAGEAVLRPVQDLVDSINTLLGKAKEAEDTLRLYGPTEPKRLEAPKPQLPKPRDAPATADLDDEIPF
jgi:hypothetical protein